MRVPELTNRQLYYQFKNAMDEELSRMVEPHMYVEMEWQNIVNLAMKFDETRKKSTTFNRHKPRGQFNNYRGNNNNRFGNQQ